MGLTADQLKASLDALAEREPLIAAAIGRVGYPPPRIRDRGYETLLRTIVGQQVSVAGPRVNCCLEATGSGQLPLHGVCVGLKQNEKSKEDMCSY